MFQQLLRLAKDEVALQTERAQSELQLYLQHRPSAVPPPAQSVEDIKATLNKAHRRAPLPSLQSARQETVDKAQGNQCGPIQSNQTGEIAQSPHATTRSSTQRFLKPSMRSSTTKMTSNQFSGYEENTSSRIHKSALERDDPQWPDDLMDSAVTSLAGEDQESFERLLLGR